MLPAVTVSVSKTIGFIVPDPDGLVGSGDGAPAGAAKLVVTFTEVPAAMVVPDWNVMLSLHDPSGGYVAATPTVALLIVPVLDAVDVLQGNAAAGKELGFDEGVAELVGAVVGAVPEEPPPHPASAAIARSAKKVVLMISERTQ